MKITNKTSGLRKFLHAIFRRVFNGLRKSPEMQLVTVLVLGVMASSLIIFGFTIDEAKDHSRPINPVAAQTFTQENYEVNGQTP